jgi:hypothetical protein
MRAPAALLALAALFALSSGAAEGRLFRLTLPHELREGETAILEVTLGRLTTREPIEVRTATGRLLGAVSTLGVPRGREAGTYLVPVPNDAIVKGALSIRLSIGRSRRAPTREEVKAVKLTIRPS